jgi:hypothetical protein
MTKQDEVTGYHVRIVLWFISGFFTLLIGLLVYIWQDNKADNRRELELQQIQLTTIQETLNRIIETNILQDKDISAIKEWQRLWEKAKEKSNTRGLKDDVMNNIQLVPDEGQVAARP